MYHSGVKMLVSPPILAATKEPILTAFSVSNKLYILAKRREEYRDIYSSLAQEVPLFHTSYKSINCREQSTISFITDAVYLTYWDFKFQKSYIEHASTVFVLKEYIYL